MPFELDKLNVEYAVIAALERAQEADIITEEEATAAKVAPSDRIRVLLDLEPAE